MATFTIPTRPGFIKRRWALVSNTQVHESPLSGTVNRMRLAGERWMGEWSMPPIKGTNDRDRDIMADWEVFFAQLEGRNNSFSATPPWRGVPRGIATGSPVVNGASQTGSTLSTTGWTASQTGILKKGDYIQLDDTGQMCVVTADVNSNGSGVASVPIKPPLRTSPANSSAITVTNPVVKLILVSDEVGWEANAFGVFEFSFSGVEVFE